MSTAAAPSDERLSFYHLALLAMLGIATLYEGFDASMLTLASPDVRKTLDIRLDEWGTLYAITRGGMIASFFFLMSADRFGRKPLLLITVAGFALTTGATAFSQTQLEFTIWQTAARLFLTAQYGLAIIIASEEFPARWRGVGITVLTSFATVGTVTMAMASPFFLLEGVAGGPPPAGNWAHDTALAAVAGIARWLDLPFDGAHWRSLYLVGALPLFFLPLIAVGMRETARFQAISASRARASALEVFRAQFAEARRLFEPRYFPRFTIVTLLWNCVHLVTSASVAFWAIYAREQVGMSVAQVANVVTLAYIAGAFGHLIAGLLVDGIGRKLTCSLFYSLAAVAIVALFHTGTSAGQYFWHITTVAFFSVAIGATHVYSTELFPTELRATGYGWATNFFGRGTEVIVPVAVGQLIPILGISWSVTAVGIGPVLGAVLIWKYATETRGLTLEQIQERFGDGSGRAEPQPGAPA